MYQINGSTYTLKESVNQPTNGSTVSKEITGLTGNTPYTFCVKAFNEDVGSGYSSTVSFTTPDIYGLSTTVCYEGSQFELLNPPSGSGTIKWTVSNTNFTVVSPGNPTTVKRKGMDNGSATLSALNSSDQVIATKTITPCAPPNINGSTSVCPGSTNTYSLSYNPNVAVTWSGSNMTPQNNNTGTSKIFTASSSFKVSSGWVIASINVNNTQVEIARKQVNIGNIISIDGLLYLPTNGSSFYQASFMCPCVNCPVSWQLTKTSDSSGGTYYANGVKVKIVSTDHVIPPAGGLQAYKLTAYVGLATSHIYIASYNELTIQGEYPPIILLSYPNPVSNILNIEIDVEATAQARSLSSGVSSAGSFNAGLTFDVRLFDGQGNLLRQNTTKGGTVQFNVSNLPTGIYSLHVYDGVSEAPEIRQIIVEH